LAHQGGDNTGVTDHLSIRDLTEGRVRRSNPVRESLLDGGPAVDLLLVEGRHTRSSATHPGSTTDPSWPAGELVPVQLAFVEDPEEGHRCACSRP
jgi:hypothetical protein